MPLPYGVVWEVQLGAGGRGLLPVIDGQYVQRGNALFHSVSAP
jgi:hypothetical protein